MVTTEQTLIEWQTLAFTLYISVNSSGVPCIDDFVPKGCERPAFASQWFESPSIGVHGVRAVGEGNTTTKTCKSLIGSYLSERMCYECHSEGRVGHTQTLDITSFDHITGLRIIHHFVAYDDVPVLRSFATVTNPTDTPRMVSQLSSFTIGGMTAASQKWWDDYTISVATNSWFREAMWKEQSLGSVGIDNYRLYELGDGHKATLATYAVSNRGSFSTNGSLPMGLLARRDGKDSWLWQVESNGSWKWEIGDYKDSVYLAAGGPTAYDHDWTVTLAPGESFTSVPVACCHVRSSAESAFAAITNYRRRILRPHPDYDTLPIIFNDYMNCLMGDPDEDKIKALLAPVARSGAEYFVIDAGWYADDLDWWDDVGLWQPSQKRFPSGFKNLLDTIRAHGLIPGVWLEPEVVGIRSIVGSQLPEAAFFQHSGQRIVERGRFQLDYRHPVVRERMHGIIDNLVRGFGVGYFKFDYNIEVLLGSDIDDKNTGVAHLEHQRAYLGWVEELLRKYPALVFENCSSGGQRMDYAMLAIHTLQCTSDQQKPEAYAAIAAAVPTAVLPEQSATWAYPQGEWSDEMNALTVINSLLGRVHLSGRLDHLKSHQYDLIKAGMDVYKSIRQLLRHAHPFWPLGLPSWESEWVALGMKCTNGDMLLSVWRRAGPTTHVLPLPLTDSQPNYRIELLYPLFLGTKSNLKGIGR
ncbi:glycoside hydrolase superfamily [Pyrenochaeta sp. MPI-SDFR-AT-0127]|nr:glycoside hydrolase superfamily [Pyrenochaeta sp. MPI-SDFR-AT-0127]